MTIKITTNKPLKLNSSHTPLKLDVETINGVEVVTRFLFHKQIASSENGIYDVAESVWSES
jgi:hypothetical protein